MNILFVCKFNRYRSKMAEAFFNKLNKDKTIKAESAGLIEGRPITEDIKECAKRFGVSVKGKPRGISTNLLIWQDILIIAADNVPETVFSEQQHKHKKKLIVWKLSDVGVHDRNTKAILEKVSGFVKQLEAEKSGNK